MFWDNAKIPVYMYSDVPMLCMPANDIYVKISI